MTRIGGGISTGLTNLSNQTGQARATKEAPSIGQQVEQVLFGRRTPPVLDPQRFPELLPTLGLLNRMRKKLATWAGDEEDDYEIVLAQGAIAMIDGSGTIFIGAEFMAAFASKPEVLVGALAHEIGHRPKRWRQYQTRRQLSREEMEALCRHEETRADLFAGKALAELELSAEPLIEFLKAAEDRPHPEYFPAADRERILREAHQAQTYRRKARRTLFPGFNRMTAPKGHLGDY